MAVRSLILAGALVLGATAAQAATYNVATANSTILCWNVVAANPREAMSKCFSQVLQIANIPPSNWVLQPAKNCRSTHNAFRISPMPKVAQWTYNKAVPPQPGCAAS
jgi:hypothetical protein